ncbi:unnamed protein product [Cladocopium goreaui]|uniref:Uncharacterized protein n=1 Tax=Cladocopium goreaui TaxID=2562237 RepID=A0A9P1C3M1_9DINO|nr:unnamed protein product [Cladocopium goreaui]
MDVTTPRGASLVLGAVLVFLLTWVALHHFTQREVGWFAFLGSLTGFSLSFLIILLVPYDISQTLSGGDKVLMPFSWDMMYWASFLLCWVTYPLLSEYEAASGFTVAGRLMSLRSTWCGLYVAGTVLLLLCLVVGGFSVLAPWCLAMANAWALLVSSLLMAYGLVAVPRQFWRQASPSFELKRLYCSAVALDEARLGTQYELQDTIAEARLETAQRSAQFWDPSLERAFALLQLTMEECELLHLELTNGVPGRPHQPACGSTPRRLEQAEDVAPRVDYLAQLHGALRQASIEARRTACRWEELINRCLLLEDIEVRIFFPRFWKHRLFGPGALYDGTGARESLGGPGGPGAPQFPCELRLCQLPVLRTAWHKLVVLWLSILRRWKLPRQRQDGPSNECPMCRRQMLKDCRTEGSLFIQRNTKCLDSGVGEKGLEKGFECLDLEKVSTSQVDECSGLAASKLNDDLYWVNNDSGAGPVLYGIRKNGQHVARLRVSGAGANDWEDIAIGPGPTKGKSYIYVADVGDNYRKRGTVQIYRMEEPKVERGRNRNDDIRVSAVRFDVTYPNNMKYDCESIFIDKGKGARKAGTEGRVYLITKGDNRASDPQWRGGDVFYVDLPRESASLSWQATSTRLNLVLATGADITPRGNLIAVRTYGEIQIWPRPCEWSVEEALSKQPCGVASKNEQQGEAIAFGKDGDHYITVSEGKYPKVWYFGMTQRFQKDMMDKAKAEAKAMEAQKETAMDSCNQITQTVDASPAEFDATALAAQHQPLKIGNKDGPASPTRAESRVLRLVALATGALSVLILSRQIMLFFDMNGPWAFGSLTQGTQAVYVLTLGYLVGTTYWSSFRWRAAGWYGLYSNRNTDTGSLLWCATLLSRLVTPLSYHFLLLIQAKGTSFQAALDEMDVVPTLLPSNKIFILILLCLVLCHFLNVSAPSNETLSEGRRLVELARRRRSEDRTLQLELNDRYDDSRAIPLRMQIARLIEEGTLPQDWNASSPN